MLNDAQTKEAPVVCYYTPPGHEFQTIIVADVREQVDLDPTARQLVFNQEVIRPLSDLYDEVTTKFDQDTAIQFLLEVIGSGVRSATENKQQMLRHHAQNTLPLFRPAIILQDGNASEEFMAVYEYLQRTMNPGECDTFCINLALHGICVALDVKPDHIFSQQQSVN